jgi:hypothetical protein
MRDFGITKYCKNCKKEIIHEGELVTFDANSEFCECGKSAVDILKAKNALTVPLEIFEIIENQNKEISSLKSQLKTVKLDMLRYIRDDLVVDTGFLYSKERLIDNTIGWLDSEIAKLEEKG